MARGAHRTIIVSLLFLFLNIVSPIHCAHWSGSAHARCMAHRATCWRAAKSSWKVKWNNSPKQNNNWDVLVPVFGAGNGFVANEPIEVFFSGSGEARARLENSDGKAGTQLRLKFDWNGSTNWNKPSPMVTEGNTWRDGHRHRYVFCYSLCFWHWKCFVIVRRMLSLFMFLKFSSHASLLWGANDCTIVIAWLSHGW